MHPRLPGRLILAASLLLAAISFGCPDENQIPTPQASSSTKKSATDTTDPAVPADPISAAEPATAALILLGGGVAWLIGRRRKPSSGNLLE